MNNSNFSFLNPSWPALYESARRSELAVRNDPRAACFYSRRALELLMGWVFSRDESLQLPYQSNLSALIHEPSFARVASQAIVTKARLINKVGNRAVHQNNRMTENDAMISVRELFQICYWLAHTYAPAIAPPATTGFNPDLVPKMAVVSAESLNKLVAENASSAQELSQLLAKNEDLDAELQRARAKVAEAKKAAVAQPDTHDYSEAETRDYFIDLLLKEAGWSLSDAKDTEYKVSGMPEGKDGFVDYVLWGDDGKPLGLVEAKRTKLSARKGQQQAKLYADCLEEEFGVRPIIFCSNGYEHWIWDDTEYPPRRVDGFYNKSELQLVIQRRSTRKPLETATINRDIAGRYYQERAIRRIAEAFEKDKQRRALLVMATGAGKTRTVVALSDLLMRCNWAKRVLFLADRRALVNQAVDAFKINLPTSSPVNLVKDRKGEGRVYVSTYPTIMGLIDETNDDGQRRFGPGYFDLIVIDEAHRSVFNKYGAIFEYFDAHLVGLTATPKDEVDRNTYSLFELEDGVPTDAYSLTEAVDDGYLVPPLAIDVDLRFPRAGIKYDELSEEERDLWDEIDWNEDGIVPTRVDAAEVNKWLFNKDTVDKVLKHLMTRGHRVNSGDDIAKTIIFAKNQAHAEFIAERFDANYPHLRGHCARVITHNVDYSDDLIEQFSIADNDPRIAMSVDMLDTGIDVPEVANLVFFKVVRSKTKFWQMLGRGTRLAPDLLGPGLDKENFYIFDYCGNLNFFSLDPQTGLGFTSPSLASKLFIRRLELVGSLDDLAGGNTHFAGTAASTSDDHEALQVLRTDVADVLHTQVASMNTDNFIVRPKRAFVERFADKAAWKTIAPDERVELATQLADLPTQVPPEPEQSKRFDLLILNLQLALIKSDPAFARIQETVRDIASVLEAKSAIPIINAQMELIQDVQSDEWWDDVTLTMIEGMRRRLRALVALIEHQKRNPVFTDFEDEMGDETVVALPGFQNSPMLSADGLEKFRAKTKAYLRNREDNLAIRKLRSNRPITESDLSSLEQMLMESGIGGPDYVENAAERSHGLGLFVRSLVGLEQGAAKEALADFIYAKEFNSVQIDFVNLIIDHLCTTGVVEAARLYESPFTDVSPQGPEGIFRSDQVDQLVEALHKVQSNAVAS